MSKKSKQTTTVVATTAVAATAPVTSFVIESADMPQRSSKGVYAENLQKLVPNTKECFKISQGQVQSVRQAATHAGFKVITAAVLDADKKPTGFYRVWRTL